MATELFISVLPGEVRAAVVEGGSVTELAFERDADASIVGNIYLGRIERIMPDAGAAFVNIGLERAGFLALGDRRRGSAAHEYGATAALHEGAAVVVAAVKDAAGRKGPELSLSPSLPGRHLVYLPRGGRIAVSRRIADEDERRRLLGLGTGIAAPGEGLVIRTAAEGVSRADLEADLGRLREAWAAVEEARRAAGAPALLHADLDPVIRVLRDHALDGIDRLVLDDPAAADRARRYGEALVPGWSGRVSLHSPGGDMFEDLGIEAEIERACERRVPMPSGGDLVIEQMEALTAIDVNSGSFAAASDPERTAFEINREAAAEALRQVRLRNLSGLIVIDFIGMEDSDNWRAVLGLLEEEASRDRTPVRVLGRTRAGLVELTRRRRRRSLAQLMTAPCAPCRGSGRAASPDAASLDILRALRREGATLPAGGLVLHAAPEVANMLENRYAGALRDLEARIARRVDVRAATGFANHQYELAPG